VSCAKRVITTRFPLEIRAARTPDAPALVFRADVSHPPVSSSATGEPAIIRGRATGTREPIAMQPPCDTGDSGRVAEALRKSMSGSGTGPPFTVSFRELDLLTAAVAQGLRARGILPAERVALLLPPVPPYPALLLSLLRAGAVVVPISTRLPGAAAATLLERVGCRRLIGVGSQSSGAVAGIGVIDAGELLAIDATQHPRRQRPPSAPPLPSFDPAADATIVFTSGSTGLPKAVLHTFANHRANAAGANRNIPLRPGDRWLLSLPPWHVGGLAVVFRCLLGGATIAIKGQDESLADAITNLGVTHVSLVATQLFRLLREERGRAALSRLKTVLLGGGPIPAALIEEASREGVRLVTSYGSTEMSSQATATSPGDPPAALRTAGRPLAFRRLSIAADGEILVRGRTLCRGYVEETAVRSARDASGWFHTGDLGHFDADGHLLVRGRRDTMFISGGENIHPEEIERAILQFPGVLETVVVPVPDPEFGERPAAFLHTVDGGLPAGAKLDRFLRETLPGFKVPVRYLPWPAVTAGMKPDRRAFAALARDVRAEKRGKKDSLNGKGD